MIVLTVKEVKNDDDGDELTHRFVSQLKLLTLLFLLYIKNKVMDNKNNVGSPDRSRINLKENYEVEYWTKELGIKAEQLRKAVEEVGTSADAVRKYLKK